MSLTSALTTATHGMQVAQTGTRVASSNIANADSAGYTRKVVSSQTVAWQGGTSVRASEIQNLTNQFLLRSMLASGSDAAFAGVQASFLDSLQSALGSPGEGASLSSSIDTLANALSALALTPESASEAEAVVQAAIDLAEDLSSTSQQIQALRGAAEKEIAAAVAEINQALGQADALNDQIARNQALGLSTADLEDLRANALGTISANIGITYFTDSDNQLRIYTSSGQTLLDSSVHELEFVAAAQVDASLVYVPGAPAGLSGITVDGSDIAPGIGSGRLGGLLNLRDATLPAVQAELDSLAATLISATNAAHNLGTADPAPNALQGTRSVVPADPLTATGTLRVALLDADGNVTGTQDFNLATYGSAADMATAIDAMPGVSATFDAEGRLSVTADDPAQGVALGDDGSSVGADGLGFSHYFGLNDFFTGSGAADIAVRADLAADSARLAVGALDPTAGVGDAALASGDGRIATALSEALSGDRNFAAAGSLSASTTSLGEYAALFISSVATRSAAAGEDAQVQTAVYQGLSAEMANQVGVNLDEETAELTVLESAYSASANVLSVVKQMMEITIAMVS